MSKNVRVKKNITLPRDVVDWAEKAVKRGKYAGVRPLSGAGTLSARKERDREKGE